LLKLTSKSNPKSDGLLQRIFVQLLSVSSAGLKVSTFVHKVENPATWSLIFVGQKGNLSYDMEVMWKLT
jgi:hypothetical protein